MRRAVLLTALATFVSTPAVAAARPPCGPADAKTLARSEVARVYTADGVVRGCHRARRASRRLGSRRALRGTWVAGRYTVVRQRRGAGERLVMFDLRRGGERLDMARAVRFVRVRLDARGIGGYTAIWRAARAGRPREGIAGVLSEYAALDVEPNGPEVATDVLGLAGSVLATRQWQIISLRPVIGEIFARPGLLVRLGDLRIDASEEGLVARRRGKRPFAIEDADGFQRSGDLLAVRLNHPDRSGDGRAYLDGIDLEERTRRRLVETEGLIYSFVATPSGQVAYTNYRFYGGVPTVRAGDAVLDSGKGIDLFSLRRRGDRLVWRHSGAERSAPLPPGWR